jgi:hypothetical protein
MPSTGTDLGIMVLSTCASVPQSTPS